MVKEGEETFRDVGNVLYLFVGRGAQAYLHVKIHWLEHL